MEAVLAYFIGDAQDCFKTLSIFIFGIAIPSPNIQFDLNQKLCWSPNFPLRVLPYFR